jgi:hypothetical protein
MPISASRQRETGGSAEHYKALRRFRVQRGPHPRTEPDHPSASDLLRPMGPNLCTDVWTLGLAALATGISDEGSEAPGERLRRDRTP